VGVRLGRKVGAALGLRWESLAVGLMLAAAAGVGLELGAEAGAEQARPMMATATMAAAMGMSEKGGQRIRVSFVLIGRPQCDPRPVGQVTSMGRSIGVAVTVLAADVSYLTAQPRHGPAMSKTVPA
jgi:hypothetical protein